MQTNLVPKLTKLQVNSTKLTDSQREVIRCLLLGGIIYVDHRGKYRMFLKKETGVDHVKSGHGHNHLYRPTVLFFMDQKIIIPKKITTEENLVDRSQINWATDVLVINSDYTGDFSAEIDEVKVEAVLGVDRGTTNSKKF